MVKERKERVVHARLSVSELVAVEAAARQSEMSVSAFIRSSVLDGAGILPFLSEEERAIFELLHRDLRAIGVNLHGFVRLSHRGSIPVEVAANLHDLQFLVAGLALELRRLATRTGHKVESRD